MWTDVKPNRLSFRPEKDIPVCDKGRSQASSIEMRIGFSINGGNQYPDLNMRRTDRDRQPPKSIVTARFCGDPPPGRSALDKRA